MLIDDDILNILLTEAAESPRLRHNFDLRTDRNDDSQRMLNALLPGTMMPIHRHMNSTETVVVLKGALTEIFYDDSGKETKRYNIDPSMGVYGISVPVGQWHTLAVNEPTVIFVSKDGKYEPLKDEDTLSSHQENNVN